MQQEDRNTYKEYEFSSHYMLWQLLINPFYSFIYKI